MGLLGDDGFVNIKVSFDRSTVTYSQSYDQKFTFLVKTIKTSSKLLFCSRLHAYQLLYKLYI